MNKINIRFPQLATTMERLANVGRWVIDRKENDFFWSEQTYVIFGVEVGTPLTLDDAINFYHPEHQELIRDLIKTCSEQGTAFSQEVMVYTESGELRWLAVMGEAQFENGQVRYVYGAAQDITAKRDRLTELTSQREALNTTLNSLLDGVIIINEYGIIRQLSEPAEKMFGYTAAELIGRNIKMLMPEPYAANHDQYLKNYRDTRVAKIIGIGREVEALHKNGRVFPIDLAVTEAMINGEIEYIGTVRDISRQRAAAERIENLSFFDELTQLPNRYKFIQYVNAQSKEQTTCVMAINLDYFSRINAVHGYDIGDQILVEIAKRLKKHLGPNRILAKDIGDRFWFAMNGKGTELIECTNIANLMLDSIRQAIPKGDYNHFVTASIGMAIHGATSGELMSHAETALHRAKNMGRDQVAIYKERMSSNVLADYQLEMGLRQAVQRNELECWLQSKVNGSSQVVGAEALMRWRRFDGTLVSPASFIPIAEQLGLIASLGRWMLTTVAKLLAKLERKGLPAEFRIAVNVSPKQFLQAGFVEQVRTIFSTAGVNLNRLTLEITENLLLQNEVKVREKMATLAADGVIFSIDDFGTGYSNLSRLNRLPVSELKIDREFILGINGTQQEQELLKTIIKLAQGMNMQTVAEGIETLAQAEFVLQHGCDHLQGFYFHKPVEMVQWVGEFYNERGTKS
ncbi:putative bifunctional diguanylate cyclase/phosphodiesterase [Aliidiomarina quisquiliarum]|uniref:putative bifunctional diguanylate cyclase/phosphodiesterase n=1 Tax=Aliidiomarina quisquiliarum TaxID=2938947 RepID=UPI00208EB487|nr:bifunctional diguanylate cyclase/phosphodiesterase [Aliidiomarina quisquiliarum]MCO4320502.1 EAL domain-containing protein [Aliidiomarina quisquiliarum]